VAAKEAKPRKAATKSAPRDVAKPFLLDRGRSADEA
jgi:hypothetical protein